MDLVDRNEVQKYRKMQSELKEKTKGIEKATGNWEKIEQKLFHFSKQHYQTTVFTTLNVNYN